MFGSIFVLLIGIAMFVLGSIYVDKCGGTLKNDPGRCDRTRRGLGRHCRDHRGWNLHDTIALVAFVLGAGAVYLWFTHDGLTVLLDTVAKITN